MKKGIVLVALAVMLIFPSFMADAQDIAAQLEDTLTDNLASAEDVKWYSFEMAEYGDAIILVAGLQDQWDGYAFHWHCVVYGDDKESVITEASVRGYSSGYYGLSIILAQKLEAGTYYIKMSSMKTVNPLMASFTTDCYKIDLYKYYYSSSFESVGNEFQTFYDAGDVIWAFDGTAFLKLNDGECFAALANSARGAVVPVLISTDEDAVKYIISSTGAVIGCGGSWHHESSGIDYYYSDISYISQYTNVSADKSSFPMLYVNTMDTVSVVKGIADKLEKAKAGSNLPNNESMPAEAGVGGDNGKEESWLIENKGKVIAFGGVILGLIIIGAIKSGKSRSCKGAGSGSAYNTSQDNSSDSSYGYNVASGDSGYDQSLHDDLDAVAKAVKRTETYGPDWKGWDPEAPGPDPEAPRETW